MDMSRTGPEYGVPSTARACTAMHAKRTCKKILRVNRGSGHFAACTVPLPSGRSVNATLAGPPTCPQKAVAAAYRATPDVGTVQAALMQQRWLSARRSLRGLRDAPRAVKIQIHACGVRSCHLQTSRHHADCLRACSSRCDHRQNGGRVRGINYNFCTTSPTVATVFSYKNLITISPKPLSN